MATSDAYIRKIAPIRATPYDTGVEMIIKVKLYDQGILNFNGSCVSKGDLGAIACRKFAQAFEQLARAARKRGASQ